LRWYLGEMGYKTHILFNYSFSIIALIATILSSKDNNIFLLNPSNSNNYSTT
jgi:hypothetical protein